MTTPPGTLYIISAPSGGGKTSLVRALLGIGMGMLVAVVLAAGLKTFLFGVGPSDPSTLAGMVAVVFLITLATCWIPARRAARVDPLVALRNE